MSSRNVFPSATYFYNKIEQTAFNSDGYFGRYEFLIDLCGKINPLGSSMPNRHRRKYGPVVLQIELDILLATTDVAFPGAWAWSGLFLQITIIRSRPLTLTEFTIPKCFRLIRPLCLFIIPLYANNGELYNYQTPPCGISTNSFLPHPIVALLWDASLCSCLYILLYLSVIVKLSLDDPFVSLG